MQASTWWVYIKMSLALVQIALHYHLFPLLDKLTVCYSFHKPLKMNCMLIFLLLLSSYNNIVIMASNFNVVLLWLIQQGKNLLCINVSFSHINHIYNWSLSTYWNRFAFITLLLNFSALKGSFLSLYPYRCFPTTVSVFKQQPLTHRCILHNTDRPCDRPPKVDNSFEKKCCHVISSHWLQSIAPRITVGKHSYKVTKAAYCPVLKLTSRNTFFYCNFWLPQIPCVII